MSSFNNETLEYFKGDDLAAKVWTDKYALKVDGVQVENTPDDMHRNRLSSEFERIDKKYNNPKSADVFYEAMKDFKYIIPGGSPMSGIGNEAQIVSISNCFVIGNPEGTDSYGGICKMDEEMIHLMKRRGGCGADMSDIRPAGSKVSNAASTSTGVVPFMERFSNTTREVAQNGRRGALMLSISCKHPESDKFISAKLEQGKVTGANISIKFDDEFMNCVINNKLYFQYFPTHIDRKEVIPSDILEGVTQVEVDKMYEGMLPGSCFKVIEAKKLWDKVILNAWRSAEPGVLYWDNVLNNTSSKPYYDQGFKPVSTNPCLTGDTMVLMGDGRTMVRIDQLASECEGYSKYDESKYPLVVYSSGKKTIAEKEYNVPELRKAIAYKTGNKEVCKVTLSDGSWFRCTPDHFLATDKYEWIRAKDSKGRTLCSYYSKEGGKEDKVREVETNLDYEMNTRLIVESIEYCGKEDVYDLTVETNHNFFIVTEKSGRTDRIFSGILVHNCG